MNDSILISKEEIGIEFAKSIEHLLNIRKDKKLIYGDTYLDDEKEFLFMQMQNKLKRINLHLQNKTEINNIEKAEDNCVDLAIYSLFLLTKLRYEHTYVNKGGTVDVK